MRQGPRPVAAARNDAVFVSAHAPAPLLKGWAAKENPMPRTTSPLASALVSALALVAVTAAGPTARAADHNGAAGEGASTSFAVTADQDGACGASIDTPLGPVRGIVQVDPSSAHGVTAWATFPSWYGIGLGEIADVRGAGPHLAKLVGTLPVSGAFRPHSLRAGIIAVPSGFAIDIGTSEAKVQMQDVHFNRHSSTIESAPALSFQDGDDVFVYAFHGSTFHLLERETVPPGTAASTLQNVLISGYAWTDAAPDSVSCMQER
jgi:hypothetical protein